MAKKRVMWLIKGLGRGGAERLVEISLPYFNRNMYDYEVAYFLSHKNDVVPALVSANIPVFCVNVKYPFSLLGIIKVFSLIKRRKPDIVHMHLPYSGIIGRIIGRLAGVKNIVYTEHNIIEKYNVITKTLNIATYPLNSIAIAVSDEVQQSIKRYPFARATKNIVIKNGINLTRIQISESDKLLLRKSLGIPGDHKIVGNIAHIRPEKGQEYLIRAAALVIDRYPKVSFLIIGREKYAGEVKRLEKIAESLGILQNVIFTGFRQDVAALTSIFDIFTLSSLAEGLPLALLESMVQGKPPVTTSVGGIPEVIKDGENGLLVPPKDPIMLANKILRLLEDGSLCSRLSGNAVRTIEGEYGIEPMVKSIERVYGNLLKISSD